MTGQGIGRKTRQETGQETGHETGQAIGQETGTGTGTQKGTGTGQCRTEQDRTRQNKTGQDKKPAYKKRNPEMAKVAIFDKNLSGYKKSSVSCFAFAYWGSSSRQARTAKV